MAVFLLAILFFVIRPVVMDTEGPEVIPVIMNIEHQQSEFQNAPVLRVVKKEQVLCLEVQDLAAGPGGLRLRPNPQDARQCLLDEEKSVYIKLLMTILVGLPNAGSFRGGRDMKIRPYNAELRRFGNDWPPSGFTMTGTVRLDNFRAAVLEAVRNEIPGAIVELGVWRGGSMILADAVLKEVNESRELYLFDAYETIKGYGSGATFLEVSEELVRSHFDQLDLGGPHVHFVKGLFMDTVPAWKEKNIQIAVLRVDGNFYDSYQDAMYYFYEKVPIGGVVIFDDVMSHPAVARFWEDFKAEQGLSEELVRIDNHSAWFRKTKAVVIDWSKFHAPQDVNKK